MKTYIGVKRIQAEPQKKNGKEGYRVVYEPDGYESWSPKEVFEAAYLPITSHNKLTYEDIQYFMDASEIKSEKRGSKSTLVEITFPTGWTDYEVSSCVNPENYDELLGKNCALQNIADRLRNSLGFVLQWADHGLAKTNYAPAVHKREIHGFDWAINQLKQGKNLRRRGWNGKGMWLQLVQASEWTPVSDYWSMEADDEPGRLPWIGMVTADNHFVPWLASQTDMLADDWELAE